MTALLRLLVRGLARLADAVLATPRVDLEARLDPWTYSRPGGSDGAARPGQTGGTS